MNTAVVRNVYVDRTVIRNITVINRTSFNGPGGTAAFNQQQRIAPGVSSGQLTPGETARVEKREKNINRQVATDRAANGGKLTPQDRQQVNRKQNGASKEIDSEKHNEKRER